MAYCQNIMDGRNKGQRRKISWRWGAARASLCACFAGPRLSTATLTATVTRPIVQFKRLLNMPPPFAMKNRKPIPETVADRTLWQSYLALPAKTRMKFSIGMALFAATGLAVSNYLEKAIPAEQPSENK
ncbi:hypothetical protein B0H19DRAFT_641838 [Mycena capillaripes]|nr:hypothetical protein B0H19DRAFT_641838 [Mycena capillaripes]